MAWYAGHATFVIEGGKYILVPESVRSTYAYAETYAKRLPKNCKYEICPVMIKRRKPRDNGKSGVPDFLVAPEDEPCLTPWSDDNG